ncbi:helix-turn-helix domain-containing protein [Endozoicomonas sp.]|uniref:helix-turn-helix domain-containing protein n=1 Tax=Endozoicomonas sp. TaxID=1892382 RepID=UPI003AF5951D
MTGLSVNDVAKRLGKSRSTVHGWEADNGTGPRNMDDLVSMCQLYGITIDWYLEGREPIFRSEVYSHCPHIEVILTNLSEMTEPQRKAVAQLMEVMVG